MLSSSVAPVDLDLISQKLDKNAFLGLRTILIRLADVTERAGHVFNELNAETIAFNDRTDAISRKFHNLQEHFTLSQASSLFDEASHLGGSNVADIRDQDDQWSQNLPSARTPVRRAATGSDVASPEGSTRRQTSAEKPRQSPSDSHLAEYYRKGLNFGAAASLSQAGDASTAAAAAEEIEELGSEKNMSDRQSRPTETASVQRKSFVAKSLQRSKTSWVAQHGPLRDEDAIVPKKSFTGFTPESGPLTRAMTNITNTNLRSSQERKGWSGAGLDPPADSPLARRSQTMNIPFSHEQNLRASMDSGVDFNRAGQRQSVNVMRSQTFQQNGLSQGSNLHTVSFPLQPGQFDDLPASPMSGYPDGETTRDRLSKTFTMAAQVAQARGRTLTSISAVRESFMSQGSEDTQGSAAEQQRMMDAAHHNQLMPRASTMRSSQELQQAWLKLNPESPRPFSGSGSDGRHAVDSRPGDGPSSQDMPFGHGAGPEPSTSANPYPTPRHYNDRTMSAHPPQAHNMHPHPDTVHTPNSKPHGHDGRPLSAESSQQQFYSPAQPQHMSPHKPSQPDMIRPGLQATSPMSEYHDATSTRQSPSAAHPSTLMPPPPGVPQHSAHPQTPQHAEHSHPQLSQQYTGGSQRPGSSFSAAGRPAMPQHPPGGQPLSPHMQGSHTRSPSGGSQYQAQHTGQHAGHDPRHPGYRDSQGSAEMGPGQHHPGHDPRHPGYRDSQGPGERGPGQHHSGHDPRQSGYRDNPGPGDMGPGQHHPGPDPRRSGYRDSPGLGPGDPGSGQGHRGGTPSGQWAAPGQHDPRMLPGTPGSQMYNRSHLSTPTGQYPPGQSPHSMNGPGRLAGPGQGPGQYRSQQGQQYGRVSTQQDSSWKQSYSSQGPPVAGPLSKARPLRSINQPVPFSGQYPHPGNPPQYPPGVQPPFPPGLSPGAQPAMPNQLQYIGAHPGNAPWQQHSQSGTPPAARPHAPGNSPFANGDWSQSRGGPPEMDLNRRPPSHGSTPANYPTPSPRAGGQPGSAGPAPHPYMPEQPPASHAMQPMQQQPPSPAMSAHASAAPYTQTRELPAAASPQSAALHAQASGGSALHAAPSAASMHSLQPAAGAQYAQPALETGAIMQQQAAPQQRPGTAMSAASQRTTTSLAASTAGGPRANFYMAAKAVKSGQLSPRSPGGALQPQPTTPQASRPPSAAVAANHSQLGMMQMLELQSQQHSAPSAPAAHGGSTPPRAPNSAAGSDYLSPRRLPSQQSDPRRHVMASIDSTSTAAYSAATSRQPGEVPTHYSRGPGSVASSRPGSAAGPGHGPSPPGSARNTPTVAAARNMANRAAGSAATSPAALASVASLGRAGSSARSSPMVSPRMRGHEGMSSLMERARAVKQMDSHDDGWGDLGASHDSMT